MTRTPVAGLGTQDHAPRAHASARIYLGIDPGLSGVLASIFLFDDGSRPHVVTHDVPTLQIAKRGGKGKHTRYDLQAMARLLTPFVGLRVVAGLEQLTGRPGLSSQSVFGMGRGFGVWEAMLSVKQIPMVEVPPQTWKKALDVTRRPGEDDKAAKAESILKAQQLFPWVEFPRVKDHNAADAILLAEYMRRHYTI